MNHTELIKALETGLEGVTPGEWRSFFKAKYDEWHVSVPTEGMRIALFPDGCDLGKGYAEYIALAGPDNIRALLSHIAAQDRRIEEMRRALGMVRATLIGHGDGGCGIHCEQEFEGELLFADTITEIDAALKEPTDV